MTIPNELKRTGPRDVSLTLVGKAAVLGAVVVPFAGLVWAILSYRAVETRLAVAFLFVAINFLVNIGFFTWRLSRDHRLLSTGRAAIATTAAGSKRKWFGGHRHRRYQLQCEFAPPGGAKLAAKLRTRHPVAPMSEIVILYDPDEPTNAILYPSRLLKIET